MRRTNLALVFFGGRGSFYVAVYFVTDACLLLSYLFQFSVLSHWLGGTSPK